MPKYKKRGDGRYLYQIKTGINSKTGKAIYKNIYARTQTELDKKIAEFRVQLDKGVIIDDKNITLHKWTDQWLETYKSEKALNTKDQYENAVNKHIIPTLGDYKLKDIKQHHLQKLLNDMGSAKHGKTNKSYSKRSAEVVKMTLKQIFKKAVQNHLIGENIAEDLNIVNTEKHEKRALTVKEREILLQVCESHPIGIFIKTMYYAGLRPGEALALTASDIDFKTGMIHINKAVGFRKNGQPYPKPPKNKFSYRKVPMPNELKSALEKYIEEKECILLFPAPSGELMNESTYKRNWKSFEKQLNIAAGGNEKIKAFEHITQYHLRHNYASILYELGIDIKTAQKWFGHSETTTLLKIYTHLSAEKEAENIKVLQNFSSVSQSKISQPEKNEEKA